MLNRSDEKIRQDVRDYVPEYYEDFTEVEQILDSRAEESIRLLEAVRSVLDQYFIVKATWALPEYERIFGIQHNSALSDEERRSVVMSKMRGAGSATAEMVKQVAESFVNGEIDVENNSAEYTVKITFVGNRGIPTNLDDVEKALRDVVPAHLDVVFEFTYLRWSEVDAAGLRWSDLGAYQLTWEEFKKMIFPEIVYAYVGYGFYTNYKEADND